MTSPTAPTALRPPLPSPAGRKRVVVTGATGVLGATALPALLAAGHDVVVTLPPDPAAVIPAGVTPVEVSLFDRGALVRALDGADAVVHLATRIPTGAAALDRAAWRTNDRLRAQATATLVDAALEAGVTTFVYPSVTLLYEDGGSTWLRAGAPVRPTEVLGSSLDAEAAVARFAAGSRTRGVVLRLGGLYGPSSSITRAALRSAADGGLAVPGPASAFTATLWDADAGPALAAALEAPSGVYDVVDDDPLPRAEVNRRYGAAVGRPPSEGSPDAGLAGTVLGFLLRSHRVSNTAYRQATGWRPSVASVAEAVPHLARLAAETDPAIGAGRRP